jgi:pimeloyl-ACP methyl ester carboxylesterase
MFVDLVHTTTRDGVRLEGMLQIADAPKAWPIDGVCLVHGTGGNFYGSTLFDALGAHCLSRGCSVLRVNTRGHDGISNAVTSKGGRRLGAAYEVVDDCRHDLVAWIDLLKARVGPRVALMGHSLGAVKTIYALAHERELTLSCAIAISPPRLSYSWFCQSADGPKFLETYQNADELVQTGKPAALLDVTLPLPFVITAAGYVEKYGPDERYNFLKVLNGVDMPTLIPFGAIECANNVAFRDAPSAIAELRRSNVIVAVIADADHFYTNARPALIHLLDRWLSSQA